MIRHYTKDHGAFMPYGWVCPDCGISFIEKQLTELYNEAQ